MHNRKYYTADYKSSHMMSGGLTMRDYEVLGISDDEQYLQAQREMRDFVQYELDEDPEYNPIDVPEDFTLF